MIFNRESDLEHLDDDLLTETQKQHGVITAPLCASIKKQIFLFFDLDVLNC